MFREVKLDVYNRDLMTLFHSLRLWFYSFDICNANDDFISVNESRKGYCLFFKTCNDQKGICLVFTEIFARIYLNLNKNIYEMFTKNINIFSAGNLLTTNVLATHITQILIFIFIFIYILS